MSKLKSYNFWVRLASAVILIARIILAKFGYELDSALVIDIATLIAGLLVVLGIINEPTGITISYNETKQNNDSINSENKGDNYMTEQIKSDLMAGVQKLTDAIQDNSASGVSGVVQIITSMLDVISTEVSAEETNTKTEMSGEEAIEASASDETGVQVNFEHSETEAMDEGQANAGEMNSESLSELSEECKKNDNEVDLTIEGAEGVTLQMRDGDVVIGTHEDGYARMVEYVENIENDEITEIVDDIQPVEKIANLENLVARADEIHPEITVETAISVLVNNPDGIEQIKNYILNSDILSEMSKAQ